jgi:hypothetical protein
MCFQLSLPVRVIPHSFIEGKNMTHKFAASLALAFAANCFAGPAETPNSDQIRGAATKAVALMEKSIAALTPNVPCASCHHNMIPMWTLSIARDHGVPVNADLFKSVAVRSYSFLNDVDRAIQGTQFVDPALEGAELLAFAKSNGIKPTFTAQMHAMRLARMQRADGHWATFDARPPQSYSTFMTTALSAKAVLENMPQGAAREAAVSKARTWLLVNQPVSTEDATFRLLGLYWTGASVKQMQSAAKTLIAQQQTSTGGWTQGTVRKEADAYATGEALAALQLTGTANREVINKGLAFLLKTQAEDGSWHVKTRLHEVAPISPPYMETGFPYGKDQIISMYGTTLAVMALSLALPEQKQPAIEITEINPKIEPWMTAAAFGSIEDLRKVDLTSQTAKGSTVLMAAASDSARVAALLERGADVNAKAKSGHTALTVASAWAGSAPVLRMLIAKGASAAPVKGVEFNSNPLVYATFNGDVEAVKLLLDNGASYKQGMLLEGLVPMNPLTAAVFVEEPEILREFLKRGADANTVADLPLLSWAAASNRPVAARVLLEAGADPEMKDKFQWTPLQHARAIEHDVPGVESLIQSAIAARKQQPASSAAGGR